MLSQDVKDILDMYVSMLNVTVLKEVQKQTEEIYLTHGEYDQ